MSNLTIRAKFIVVISAAFVVATFLLLVVFSGVTDKIIGKFAISIATKQALNDRNKILAVIDREVVLAQKMADDTTLRQWFLSGDDPVLRNTALIQLESYRRLFHDKSYFAMMASTLRYYVANKSEKPTMVVLKADNPADKWYFESIKNVDAYALNLDYDAAINKIKVWINVIMKDDRGNKIGIIGSGIDVSDFLHKIVHTGENGIAVILVDKAGVIQAHQDQAMVERNALERDESKKHTIYSLLRNSANSEQLRLALQNLAAEKQNVIAFPLDIYGKKSVAAVSFMRDIGWFNIVLVDVSHVLRLTDFLPIIFVSILTLFVVIIVIGFQMNRMILAPLTLLTTASQQMVNGDYSLTVPIHNADEIGVLTKSFNVMAATVLDHTTNLEENVRLRTIELTQANMQLEKTQHLIMESLLYARVIQTSILPGNDLFNRSFAQWFTIYEPCDIVGGDLYWLRESGGRTLLAVIDCTGHGVPGAFMTMTVNSVLNQVVDTIGGNDPARILNEVNRLLQKTLNLRQDGESMVDAGLDIALCSIAPDQRALIFAGAGLSLYILSKRGQLQEIKGDRQRVGYRASDVNFSYTCHALDIDVDSNYYAVTDGFFDEGGGTKGYSFGNDRFDEMLIEHAHLPLEKQGEAFSRTLALWRGNRKQRDDITMIGFNF